MHFVNSKAFARSLDLKDPLKKFRSKFLIPRIRGKTAIYFTGNSLGLQPASAKKYISEELKDWEDLGVEGHLLSRRPWLRYHKFSQRSLAKLVGAKQSEVVAMNGLSINLHLMMTSFFKPTKKRFKIITEAGAFSSDQYVLQSHIALHGLSPDVLIEIRPRQDEVTLRNEDIIDAIKEHSDEIALIFFGAVQYYSGQFFNIPAITTAGHEVGALVGFDLAHAIGNVPLRLHEDHVDFAVWCSYKYLNAGPGAIAGIFVHQKHFSPELPRLAGWWGHDEAERFKMKKGFKPIKGAAGWQVSNFPVLAGAPLLASLEIFDEAGMSALREKSLLLTGFLYFLLADLRSDRFVVITPSHDEARGCQLSILMRTQGKKVFSAITKKGVIADWREPDVVRISPVPLYNTFEEVFNFVRIFKDSLKRT